MSTHLMIRSCYTMLGSTIRINELAARAKELGFSAVALTDRNVLHGAAQFSRACAENGIRPIYGMELDVQFEEETHPYLLLARTNKGFANLMKLSTLVQCTGHPASVSDLNEHSEGISVIVYGVDGWIESAMLKEDGNEIIRRLSVLKDVLPPFDVAVSFQDSQLWNMRNRLLKQCCGKLGLRTVAVNMTCYLEQDDAKLHQVLSCIRTQKLITDTSVPAVNGRHVLSPAELEALYDDKRDLQRTDEIAASCSADAVVETTELPSFPSPHGLSSDQYLTQLCLAGLNKRMNGTPSKEYLSRLKYELDVITSMKFSDYFLIVYDFIRYARKNGILVGPGRGSAAGSLVAYCLGITMVDPIRYGLLFERFLNPSRVSMPDIDTDIPDNRRDEVIRYVRDMYGPDHTANIVTFNTLGAKQVLRDVGKVLNIPQRDIDMLCSMVPNLPKITLRQALNDKRLLSVVKADKRFMELFRISTKLEGLPRHTSIHAAGIILSGKPLTDIIPLMNGEEGMVTSQFPAEYLEERGLIKMDFLGLRNLAMISSMEEQIRKTNPGFSVFSIPLNDSAAYELFKNADTNGIFQFESEGMKNLLRRIRPECFEDVVAAMALFRPASTDSIPVYLENKKDPSGIRYLSEELRPVLEETYGVLVYQEQTMKIAQIAAGFTLAEADSLRKAMSKKKSEDMQAMQGKFITGCLSHGYTKEQAEDLFEHILKFGGYGFNKSHAVAYGIIAYQSAYLKANYPLIFFGCLIDSSIGDSVKISQYIDECRRRGIRVLSPDINRSESGCIAAGKDLQLPLSVVKGIGVHAANEIIRERSDKPFSDYFDFIARVSMHRITKPMLESLIDAGALDCFTETRTTMRCAIDDALAYSELIRIEQNGQTVLAEGLVSRPQLVKRYDEKEEIREREMTAMGFTLGAHPIVDVRANRGITDPPLIRLVNAQGHVNGFGYVKSVRPHQTKKGAMMAFVMVNDETSELSLLVMPSQYQHSASVLRKGIYIRFDGKMTEDGKCIVNSVHVVQ